MENVFVKYYWDEEDTWYYVHYVDGWAVRQIELSPEGNSYLTKENAEDYEVMADQQLDKDELQPDNFISPQEFEEAWNKQ